MSDAPPPRNTQVTKGIRRELVKSGLPPASLEIVKNLIAEGCRELVVRDTLGLTPQEWRHLRKPTAEGDPSPLAEAIEAGIAAGASEVISTMRAAMRAGDVRAAQWLGEKVYKIGTDTSATDTAPRIQIVLNAPMELDAFRSLGESATPTLPSPPGGGLLRG